MFRNQYDTDVTVWSPQGRLHQVEYARTAVTQGSACCGLRSDTHVVLAGLKRQASELAEHQQKIFSIDGHMGMAIAGLTADARVLRRFMQTECLNHKYVYDSSMQTSRLVEKVADKHQQCTQSYVRRPYGVGLLIAGYDSTGPHLFETSPSGIFYEYNAMAIGARSQSAKTYFTRYFEGPISKEGFGAVEKDDLIKHAIKALRGCCHGEQTLNAENVEVAVVGKGTKFHILKNESIEPYVKAALADVPDDDEDDDDDEDEIDSDDEAEAKKAADAMDTTA